MKKILALLLALTCIFALMTGCAKQPAQTASGGAADEPVTVTIWVNGGEDAYIPCVAKDFEATHPNIKLDLLLVPQGESFQKIMTTISTGGKLPDIVDLNLDNLGQIIDLGLWEDLEAEPYKFDVSKTISYVPDALRSSDGKLVALMADLTTCAVAYDRDLAKQYLGTDDPDGLAKLLSSTQDYIDYAKKVTEESNGSVYAFASPQDAWDMLYAELVDEPLVKDGKLNIDDSIGGIFRFVEQLRDNGSLGPYEQWSSEWVNNISQSETLFYGCPLWFVDWGLVSNDATGGGRWGIVAPSHGATSGGEIFLIPKASEDAKKQAAYTFMEWLCATQEGAEALYKDCGMISAYSGVQDESNTFYTTSHEAYGGQNVLGAFIAISKMDSTRIRPLTKYDSGIFDSCRGILSAVAQGLSAEDALSQAKEDIISKYPELNVN